MLILKIDIQVQHAKHSCRVVQEESGDEILSGTLIPKPKTHQEIDLLDRICFTLR